MYDNYSMFYRATRNILLLTAVLLLSGCTRPQEITEADTMPAETAAKEQPQSLSYSQLAPYTSTLEAMNLPEKQIIALGEATHGNRDFTLLRQQVFEKLAEEHGVRAFVLEGDFGGCRVVNEYIRTGEGTAEEAASAIGFAIYRTREMADLLEWMQEFNSGREPADQIRFYGFDMQRYDNNKEGLFRILADGAPDLLAEYQALLEGCTDESMFTLDRDTLEQTLTGLEQLNERLKADRTQIAAAVSEPDFELAKQYAVCITENTRLRMASNYGTLRDQLMAEKVRWILEFETEYYGSQQIFITGHNGHIGKSTATVGTERVMGDLLAEEFGDNYYAIGTEFYESRFLASDAVSGERIEFEVTNKGEERLAFLLHQSGTERLFFDIRAAVQDPELANYLEERQPISMIGDSFSGLSGITTSGYTLQLAPAQTFDGLIFVDSAVPPVMLDAEE